MGGCSPSLLVPDHGQLSPIPPHRPVVHHLPPGCTILPDLHTLAPTHPFLAVLVRWGEDTCKVSLGREEKGDSVPFPMGTFPAESDSLYGPPRLPQGFLAKVKHWFSWTASIKPGFFPSLRQLGGWQPAEVNQVHTGGLERGLESAEPGTEQGRTPRTWQWIPGELPQEVMGWCGTGEPAWWCQPCRRDGVGLQFCFHVP